MICMLASIIDAHNLKLSELGKTTGRLTQKKISEDTKIAATTINRLFNNSFDRVDRHTATTLCNYFECEIGDLFIMCEVEPDE